MGAWQKGRHRNGWLLVRTGSRCRHFGSREHAPQIPYPDGPNSTNLIATADCDKGLAIIREDNYAQLAEAYAILRTPSNWTPFRATLCGPVGDGAAGLGNRLDADGRREDAQPGSGPLEELAPSLGATYVAQSINSCYDWDFPAAERYACYRASRQIQDMNWATLGMAYMLALWGRPERPARNSKSANAGAFQGHYLHVHRNTYYAQRDFTNAIIWYQKDIDLDGHRPPTFIG